MASSTGVPAHVASQGFATATEATCDLEAVSANVEKTASLRDKIINAIYDNHDAGAAADAILHLYCLAEVVLANVRPEIREEVTYAIQLAVGSCPICEGTGRATWLDDCEECKPQKEDGRQ